MGHTTPYLITTYVNECGDSDIEKTICLTESVQIFQLIFHLCKYVWSYNIYDILLTQEVDECIWCEKNGIVRGGGGKIGKYRSLTRFFRDPLNITLISFTLNDELHCF